MANKKTRAPVPEHDPVDMHPEAYAHGQAVAERLINSPEDRERVRWVFDLVERHLAHWPHTPGKNGLTELQYAGSCGFRDRLMRYLQDRSDA